jgi:hypothetical protein
MSTQRTPRVLIIDDERSDGEALELQIADGAEVTVATPDELTKGELSDADLILVDYELGNWSGSKESLTSPSNGLALGAVVREQIGELSGRGVTGIALYSGQVDEIAGTLPNDVRAFAVARLTNIEWVFEKQDQAAHEGVVSLANAIRGLPRNWPEASTKATKSLHGLLSLDPKAPYAATAIEDIAACHPPIHELSNVSHALSVIRWLAHRILPYPTFLDDQVALAARLRVSVTDLGEVLAGNSKLTVALEGVSYKGALDKLYRPHWWRSGIDDLIFKWTDGSGEMETLRAHLTTLAGRQLNFLKEDVVPVIDETYRAVDLAPVDEAVRVQLDDWPVFADDAWAKRDVVAGSARLKGLVMPEDARLLDSIDA